MKGSMIFKSLVGLGVAVVLVGCASSSGGVKNAYLPPPDPVALAEIGSSAEYRVGPMDVLDVVVFQAPELTRPLRVDASGQIEMPLIGAVMAAGRTPRELQEDLTAKLQEKYLQDPQVSVTVKEFASQRVTIDGSVTAPGVYPISGRMTLMQAVAMAKGADKLANQRDVVIFRTVNGQKMAARFDLVEIRDGKADDPSIYANDVIIVDRSGTRSMLREVIGTLPLVSIFRPLMF